MNEKSKEAIGVFDSGIGGLTVASAIARQLPKEKLIYFGDTAHLPYGDKSPEAIKYYSLKIAKFLLDKHCKAIVIACNTASSLAYSDLLLFLGDNIPVFNVIDPVVEAVVSTPDISRVGVIATKATIKSNVFPEKINLLNPDIKVQAYATPLLAPMIEEGFFNNKISSTIIDSYLSSPKLKKIDSLVLACTHYPLIKTEIERYYHDSVAILNTAEIVAEYVKKELTERNLLNNTPQDKTHQFYVSDYTESFEKSSTMFFSKQVQLVQQNIFSEL